MAGSESTFETVVLPVVQRYAAMHFAAHPDGERLASDAESEAWLGYTAKPEAKPESLAWYAVKRAKSGRQFQESARSITGPNPRRQAKPEREGFDPRGFFREADNPARIVATRLDYWAWFATLSKRKQRIVAALADDETTGDVAERFGLSEGRVSQIRRECLESWRAFTR